MASRRSGPLRAFRVADVRHPLFDGTGALLFGARWNSPGRRIVYAAEAHAGALLEILVHAGSGVPRGQAYIQIDIPESVLVEKIGPEEVPGWDAASYDAGRAFGDRWYDQRRTAVLLVPSVVARVERNVLINQEHPDFTRIHAGPPVPVRWDRRLWGK